MTTLAFEHPRKIGALRALYLYTLVGAGSFGVWILLAPRSFEAALAIPPGDPYVLGIVGAIWAAFAVSAALGLRAPEKFAPVFLLQLLYKALWMIIVFAPRAVHGAVPGHSWLLAAVFASYVIFDLIALPFSSLRSRGVEPTQGAHSAP